MKKITNNNSVPSAADDCAQAINESWLKKSATVQGNGKAKPPHLSDDRELKETVYGSEDYKTTLALRHRVLRAPLGLNLWHENLSVEIDQRHFSIWLQSGVLVACLVIVPLAPGCVKLRQMAVNPDYQRQGSGQQLIAAVESILFADGIRTIELHARISAENFYKACGYNAVGEIFTEVGIEHRSMTKILNQPASDL